MDTTLMILGFVVAVIAYIVLPTVVLRKKDL